MDDKPKPFIGIMTKDVDAGPTVYQPRRFLARKGDRVKVYHCNTFPEYPYTFETITGPFEAWCGHREDFTVESQEVVV